MLSKIFSLESESQSHLESFLTSTLEFKNKVQKEGWGSFTLKSPCLVYQIFFEASTRTRVSFETACHRLGARHSFFPMDSFTSLSKGESVADSLRVFEQNRPDLIIIRSGNDPEVQRFFQASSIPVICAGFGKKHHPTQALQDLVTIREVCKKPLKDTKVLFVGDVKNSRVANSHLILAKTMGYQLGQCTGSAHWASATEWEKFSDLNEAIAWADVVIRLRTQKERGSAGVSNDYMITRELLEKHESWLMHPGPFLRNEDFEYDLPEHSQSLVWKQKENGLYTRANLIKQILEKGKS